MTPGNVDQTVSCTELRELHLARARKKRDGGTFVYEEEGSSMVHGVDGGLARLQRTEMHIHSLANRIIPD